MRLLILSFFLIVGFVGASNAAQPLWQCEIKTVQGLSDDGKIETTKTHTFIKEAWKTLTFDEASGFLRVANEQYSLKVLINGTDHYGTRAMAYYPKEKDIYLYIETWTPNNPMFIFFGNNIITGVCNKL